MTFTSERRRRSRYSIMREAWETARTDAERDFVRDWIVKCVREQKPAYHVDFYGLTLSPVVAPIYERWARRWLETVDKVTDVMPATDDKRKFVLAKGLTSSQRATWWPWVARARSVPRLAQPTNRPVSALIGVDTIRSLQGLVFARPEATVRLYRLLARFCRDYPDIGYPQGLNVLGAGIVLHVPDDDDAYDVIRLCAFTDLVDFYGASTAHVDRYGTILAAYVQELIPHQYDWLRAIDFSFDTLWAQWISIGFLHTLPRPAVFVVWDQWFTFGPHVLYQVAIGLLRAFIRTPRDARDAPSVFAHLERQSGYAVDPAFVIKSQVTIDPGLFQLRLHETPLLGRQ